MKSVVQHATVRICLALLGIAALGYGAWIGTKTAASGVTVAAAFGIAILLLVVAIEGQLPASLKVGDVSIEMYAQGKAEGVAQGAKIAAKAAALPENEVSGLIANAIPESARNASALSAATQAAAQVVREAAGSDQQWVSDNKDRLLEILAKAS